MKEPVTCPSCDTEMDLVTDKQKIGTAIGGGIGSVAGLFGRGIAMKKGALIGATVGSLVPGPASIPARAAGGLLGALFGFIMGCAIGGQVGRQIDEFMIGRYRCPQCGAERTL